MILNRVAENASRHIRVASFAHKKIFSHAAVFLTASTLSLSSISPSLDKGHYRLAEMDHFEWLRFR